MSNYMDEKVKIVELRARGSKLQAIASKIGCSPSTVMRVTDRMKEFSAVEPKKGGP